MPTAIHSFFNQRSVGSATSLIGVLLAGLGIFLYLGKEEPLTPPHYSISSTRLLGREGNSLPKEVTVQFERLNVDRRTKTNLVLWNDGSEVLDGTKVVEEDPIMISFDQGDRFLSDHVLKATNEHNKVTLALAQV